MKNYNIHYCSGCKIGHINLGRSEVVSNHWLLVQFGAPWYVHVKLKVDAVILPFTKLVSVLWVGTLSSVTHLDYLNSEMYGSR